MIMDDCTRKAWSFFAKKKSDIGVVVLLLLVAVETKATSSNTIAPKTCKSKNC